MMNRAKEDAGRKKGRIRKFMRRLMSLRVLIIIAIVTVGTVPVILAGRWVVYSYASREMENLVIEIQGQCSLIAADVATHSYLKDQTSEVVNAELEQFTYTYSSRVIVIDKRCQIVKDTYMYEEGKILISGDVIFALSGSVSNYYSYKTGYAEIYMPIYNTDSEEVIGVIGVTVTDTDAPKIQEYVNHLFKTITLIFAMLALTFAGIFSQGVIKPLNKLNKSIVRVSAGAKDARVEKRTLYEYDRVAQSVNLMLDRIRLMDGSRDEFVSNVSHELKTPMTSMKVLAESLLMQEEVPAEVYREFMGDIVSEINRENQIINDLLALVKVDRAGASLNISAVNVNELVELTLKRLSPIADARNVELVFESFRSVAAEIDEVKFTLAITNLIENAIKYNKEDGWVRVSINADHKYFYVKVSDSGIGIPDECREHIFERFYRVDKARSREKGGTGLGLAITKSVILMHHGTIKLYSKDGDGSTFTVRIPIRYVKNGGEQA